MPKELHSSSTRLKTYRIELAGKIDSSWSEIAWRRGINLAYRKKRDASDHCDQRNDRSGCFARLAYPIVGFKPFPSLNSTGRTRKT